MLLWVASDFKATNKKANIIGVDLLEIDNVPGCEFIQGDFMDAEIQSDIMNQASSKKVDLIVSDIAPNKSGHKNTDMLRMYAVAEEVLNFSINHLNKGGFLIMKLFMGRDFEDLLKQFKANFSNVRQIKPEASRKDSSEFYIIGESFI